MMARVIQVIETTETRGKGKTESDPIRGVRQLFTFDGNLLAENDPHDFGMLERSRLREAILNLLNNVDAVVHTDAAGQRFQKVREEALDRLRASLTQDEQA